MLEPALRKLLEAVLLGKESSLVVSGLTALDCILDVLMLDVTHCIACSATVATCMFSLALIWNRQCVGVGVLLRVGPYTTQQSCDMAFSHGHDPELILVRYGLQLPSACLRGCCCTTRRPSCSSSSGWPPRSRPRQPAPTAQTPRIRSCWRTWTFGE